jgi:hypothetical protein
MLRNCVRLLSELERHTRAVNSEAPDRVGEALDEDLDERPALEEEEFAKTFSGEDNLPDY